MMSVDAFHLPYLSVPKPKPTPTVAEVPGWIPTSGSAMELEWNLTLWPLRIPGTAAVTTYRRYSECTGISGIRLPWPIPSHWDEGTSNESLAFPVTIDCYLYIPSPISHIPDFSISHFETLHSCLVSLCGLMSEDPLPSEYLFFYHWVWPVQQETRPLGVQSSSGFLRILSMISACDSAPSVRYFNHTPERRLTSHLSSPTPRLPSPN